MALLAAMLSPRSSHWEALEAVKAVSSKHTWSLHPDF